jgi:hypothetical protein
VRLVRTAASPSAALVAIVVVLAIATAVAASPARVGAAPAAYRPPVPGPIAERFAPPAERWQAGNRGVDYAPAPGSAVVASADGEVTFAGQVGGALHVTVTHPDGLRTSYSFLASLDVRKGAQVRAGDQLGTAGTDLHFGVRAPDGTYLDPEALLAGQLEGRPVLVPGTAEGADPLEERRHLLGVVGDALVGAAEAAAGGARAVAEATWVGATATLERIHHAVELTGEELVAAVKDLLGVDCTDGAVAPPPVEERRIVVLVSGLGTDSGGSSAWELPTDELGYADADVVRFSYNGGRSPADGVPYDPTSSGLAGIEQRPFDGRDSQRSLAESSSALADLLAEVAERAPGVPIDVIAHSQGGVVSRLAVDHAGRDGRLPAEVESLVTLGSPHAGAPLADWVVSMQGHSSGGALLDEARERGIQAPLDPNLPAIAELATHGSPTSEVHGRAMPDGVRFTSIGARGDAIVPAGQTRDAAGHHVVVDSLHGTDQEIGIGGGLQGAHSELPSSPDALREVALAVNGMPPTCQALLDRAIDLAASEAIGGAERALVDGFEVAEPLVDHVEPDDAAVRRGVDRAGEVVDALR